MESKKKAVPNIRLLADRVLVEIITQEEVKTTAGLIIPTTATEEKSKQGRVIRFSKKVAELEGEEKVAIGDILMFSGYAGSDISYKGADYKVLRITDIFGILDPDEDGK